MFFMLLSILATQFPLALSDFSQRADAGEWKVVNDGVMGGKSNGEFVGTTKGYAEFKGNVSLENNGGFTSVRYGFESKNIAGATSIKIRLKGDGKHYQFRLKKQVRDQIAYRYEFETSGEWETVIIPLKQMTPTYRGMVPNVPNYEVDVVSEIGFLIANKQAEQFNLWVEKITLE